MPKILSKKEYEKYSQKMKKKNFEDGSRKNI